MNQIENGCLWMVPSFISKHIKKLKKRRRTFDTLNFGQQQKHERLTGWK